MSTIALIDTQELEIKKFNEEIIPKIHDIVRNGKTVLVCDTDITLLRFFANRKYVNITVYHTGDRPKYKIGNFKYKGGYLTKSEIVVQLKESSDEFFEYKKSN